MREAGDVCFADVSRDGTGMVEYMRYEDMKHAIKTLDDSRFKSHEVKKQSSRMSSSLTTSIYCVPSSFRARRPTSA